MARDRVSIDQFPGAVMAQLEEYVAMASDEVKEAVRTVSEDVKAEIQSRAPVKTGKYKKSWTVTKVEETAQSLVNTVHSAKHYRLTHLLENGHAKRGGGRTRSFSHIAPGEALAEKELLEIAASETGKFALLFEFDGDVRKIRHVLYNCSASRPSISAKTNEESREVQTETLTVKARPLSTGYVKAKTGDSTKASVYNNWYKNVYQPADTPAVDEDETAAGGEG